MEEENCESLTNTNYPNDNEYTEFGLFATFAVIHFIRHRMISPEMVEVELGIPCIRAEMIEYEFLHRFLSTISPLKINFL